MQLMLGAFTECTEKMISSWDKLTESKGSCELDISQEFHSLTGDMLSKAAFGSNFGEGKLIFSLLREQCELVFTAKLAINVFPWLRYFEMKYIILKIRHTNGDNCFYTVHIELIKFLTIALVYVIGSCQQKLIEEDCTSITQSVVR